MVEFGLVPNGPARTTDWGGFAGETVYNSLCHQTPGSLPAVWGSVPSGETARGSWHIAD